MKKLIAITTLSVFSTVFLIFSIFVFSATTNSSPSRFLKLSPISVEAISDSQDDSITSEVYSSTPSISEIPVTPSYTVEPDKVVYITIDDGPNPITSPLYIEALKAANVKATFFMIGKQMNEYPDIVREMVSGGNVIGNHSYSHNYSSVYRSVYSLDAEITKTNDIINEIVGKQPKIFRAPGGSLNLIKRDGLEEEISKLGYVYFDWNVSAADTDRNYNSKEKVISNMKTQSKGRKRVVALMHDNGRKASVEALPEIIQWFKDNGYEFGTLNENIRPEHFR